MSAVGGGGAAYSFFKYSGIIIAGMKADGLGNLLDIGIPLEKKLFGFLYSKVENVVYNSGASVLFKYGIAVNGGKKDGASYVLEGDDVFEVFMKVIGYFQCKLAICLCARLMFKHGDQTAQ